MGSGASVDPLNPPVRCVGTLDGPVGDCDVAPTVVLLTMGFIDEDGQAFEAAAALSDLEPVPIAFVLCPLHKKAVAQWARKMWGAYFDGDFFPVSALPRIIEKLGSDGLPTAVNPDPAWALELTREWSRTAG